MADLIESRISDIRAEAKSVIDAGYRVLHVNASDLEALLAERDGMKAEIERLRKEMKLGVMQGCDGNCAADGGYPAICEMYRDNHVAGCTRQSKAECCGAITLHAYDCTRAAAPLDPQREGWLMESLQRSADEAGALPEYAKAINRAHDAQYDAPLDPSSAPSETPELEREGVRCAKCQRWHSGIGNDDRETDLCEDCWRSPDREAGSATDDAETGGKVIDLMVALKESLGLDASHPVPSEGGGAEPRVSSFGAPEPAGPGGGQKYGTADTCNPPTAPRLAGEQ